MMDQNQADDFTLAIEGKIKHQKNLLNFKIGN